MSPLLGLNSYGNSIKTKAFGGAAAARPSSDTTDRGPQAIPSRAAERCRAGPECDSSPANRAPVGGSPYAPRTRARLPPHGLAMTVLLWYGPSTHLTPLNMKIFKDVLIRYKVNPERGAAVLAPPGALPDP